MEEPTKYNKYEVQSLLKLDSKSEFKLERIFNVYKQSGGKFFYYDLLNTINFPGEIDNDSYETYYTQADEPWTTMSFKFYQRIDLWWIIACINQIDDTFTPLPAGYKLMIPKSEVIRTIIDEIKLTR